MFNWKRSFLCPLQLNMMEPYFMCSFNQTFTNEVDEVLTLNIL